MPTQSEKGSDHVLDRIDYLYKKATQLFKNKKHTIGIGTPGSISQKNGLLRNSTIYCQNGLPLLNLIENKLQHSVVIENYSNFFALSEAKIGAGKSYSLVFGIILGSLLATLSAYLTTCRSGGTWYFYCGAFFQLGLGIIAFSLPVLVAIYFCKKYR